MKKLIFLVCLFLSVVILHAKAIQEDIRKADEIIQISYAFGMLFGSNLSTIPLEFDYEAFAEGFKAMILEEIEPQFTEQEAIEIVETAMHFAMERVSEENRRKEIEFLAGNSRRPEVHMTPSGLQYEIINETDGQKPQFNSIVRVNYTGTFIDGTVFDMSDSEGAYIPIEMVIPGWTEGLMLMSVGSTYLLYIPSSLAYGRNGIQNIIPPYSTLIFSVELIEIMDSE